MPLSLPAAPPSDRLAPNGPPPELRHSLADHLAHFVWATDPAGHTLYCNPFWYEYTGLTEAQTLPDRWADAVHPDDLPGIWAAADSGRAAAAAFEYEARFRRADGEYRWHLGRVTPVRDAAGHVVRWVGSATDIEDRKRAEAALRDADRRKDEFLAVLGHELRGPLAPLRGGLEVLQRAGGDPAVAGLALGMMGRQLAHLVRLVDDLLDVSRINRGKVRLRAEPLDLRAVVDRAVETARPLVDARGHDLAVDLPADPLPITGDDARLTQVVVNLLHNAAKYTEPGGHVKLAAERDGGDVVLTVRDTGIGILPHVLPRVFDLFAQGDRAADQAQGGLGIGLTVVKSLVELHGGTVAAASDGPGTGATFTIRLPLAEGGVPAADCGTNGTHPHTPRPPHPLKVLVVDDNVDAARMAGLLLKLWGHDARTAHDGPAALAVADTFRPDVVLLDIGLPGLNGYEVADRLRAVPGLAGVRLVAVTGYGHEEDRRRSAAAGFAGHLVKPVEPAALEAIVGRPAAAESA
ncbi:MAG TPA: ATP-binding protein [Gemmataceae bacterium]|jgi:two-component system CheB/CheR fusion protein